MIPGVEEGLNCPVSQVTLPVPVSGAAATVPLPPPVSARLSAALLAGPSVPRPCGRNTSQRRGNRRAFLPFLHWKGENLGLVPWFGRTEELGLVNLLVETVVAVAVPSKQKSHLKIQHSLYTHCAWLSIQTFGEQLTRFCAAVQLTLWCEQIRVELSAAQFHNFSWEETFSY